MALNTEPWEEFDCPLKGERIQDGLCYDIQMVRGGSINVSVLGFELDRNVANSVCDTCPFNQLKH